ncbi:hypothetical protein [Neobacillus vireti]|uniref:hypothetical protein n=1 Tax=Neobacillus vireti TaxID=220686 RepID=UPI002FFFFFDE
MAKVKLKNTVGVVKEVKVGFSWTQFFFGAWVYVFRGMWSEFFKCFFLHIITLGIYNLVQCWTCNKKTIVTFIEKGYEPASNSDRELLVSKNIVA